MTVPEAAMHETDGSEPTKHQVRRSGELPIMQTVPEATRMQRSPKNQLGFRVLATDPRHHPRPNRSINYVGHQLPCFTKEERDCTCISRNVVEAIKEDRVILQRIAWGEFQRPKESDTLPHSRLMDQSQRRNPLSQLAPTLFAPPR